MFTAHSEDKSFKSRLSCHGFDIEPDPKKTTKNKIHRQKMPMFDECFYALQLIQALSSSDAHSTAKV